MGKLIISINQVLSYRLTTWRDWMGLALIIAGIVDVWHALSGRGLVYIAAAIVTWAIAVNTFLFEYDRKRDQALDKATRALPEDAD